MLVNVTYKNGMRPVLKTSGEKGATEYLFDRLRLKFENKQNADQFKEEWDKLWEHNPKFPFMLIHATRNSQNPHES